MKRIITITYKNGKTETHNFKDIVAGETYMEIVPQDKDKRGADIQLSKVKEITIK